MKKWQKILLWILAIIVLLIGVAYSIYKFKIEPQLETELEKAQEMLNDEEFQKKVDNIVFDMQQSGMLNEESVNDYLFSRGVDINQSSESSSASNSQKGQSLAPSPTPTEAPKKSTKLMDRVKEAMTADEFSFAMSVYGRLDVGYCMSNMNTDREAVKAYVRSVLSEGEISRALSIYSKYSYLLK